MILRPEIRMNKEFTVDRAYDIDLLDEKILNEYFMSFKEERFKTARLKLIGI